MRRGGNQNQKRVPKTEKSASGNKDDHCTFCGRDGHKKEGCFKVIGYPEWWPGKVKKENNKPRAAMAITTPCPIPGLSADQYQTFLKLFVGKNGHEDTPHVANIAGREDSDEEWVVDSGATEHITYQRILNNLHTSSYETPVTIPNGESIPIKGKGDPLLKTGINVKGVLFIPDFKCNLLSVRKLTKDLQCAITFFPDIFMMQGLRTGDLIGVGKCSGGLYRMGEQRKEEKQ
ncbi:hypothetical protein E3N88_31422 [Mikania micrantha]|uniref:Retrovirus-related Pol polyprotein from transposon TNT 1-94-like beta-barrel domain-containing protein n=1 Tax=Mikania micrantha TaxID=192012 RepID=A0A5N6MPZ7_9ASTR|nr:hypothetical protein E3N88_31422 [Mikania micrantha]